MADEKKKQIQRKIDQIEKKYEKIKKRYIHIQDSLLSREREAKRLALVSAINDAKSKMRAQSDSENFDEIEQDIDMANNSSQRIDEIDGVEEEGEADENQPQNNVKEQLEEEGRERVKEEVKKRLKKKAKKEVTKKVGKTVAKKGVQQGFMALLRNPYVLAVLAIILLIVLIIVGLVACSANKTFSEDGGSAFTVTDQQNPEHQVAVTQIRSSVSSGNLVLADEIKDDILGENIYKIDYRLIKTLEYLADKRGHIGVRVLYSNGPDYVYRQNVSKEAEEFPDEKRAIDAISAYKLGQAVGITSVGYTSADLANACFAGVITPIEVDWQKVSLEGTVRPVYEQLQVDATNLFYQAEVVANLSSAGSDTGESIEVAQEILNKITNNLNKLSEIEEGFSGTQGYIADSIGYIDDAASIFNQGDWGDIDSELVAPISETTQRIFRMMQVANMDKWYGNTDNNCAMWKAFEARQNIRALVVDVMKMPVELAGEGDEGFNNDYVVKQLIVYSPEDDLDNGPMDLDIFPPGITSVGAGGVAIGSSEGGDGIIDYKDDHFMSLPIDNGVFSKACSEFVYKADNTSGGGVLADLAPEGLRTDMCRLLYGNERTSVEGETSGLVSYKKFIHIGF